MLLLRWKKIAICTYPGLHFLFALGTPLWQSRKTLHKWKRQFPRSMYPAIFNSFPVIRITSAKNRCFHVPQPTFLFPLEMPLRLSRTIPWQNWMVAYLGYTLRMRTLFRGWPIMVNDTHTRRRRRSGKTIQCLPNPSQHVPIYLQ